MHTGVGGQVLRKVVMEQVAAVGADELPGVGQGGLAQQGAVSLHQEPQRR
jgi:hypothetical protein